MKFLCSVVLTFCFLTTSAVGPLQAQGFANALPEPGTMLSVSRAFTPVLMKGMTVNLQNPFQLDFVIHPGESGFDGDEFRAEAEKTVKYFLASLAVPDDELWVNLSPHEKDRIIPESFGRTDMGRDLLVQDYLLKQLTASLMHPESETGKKFWEKAYEKVYQLSLRGEAEAISERNNSDEIASSQNELLAMTDSSLHDAQRTTNEIIESFNKVWIVPGEIEVYEHQNHAFIAKNTLKVMLEGDYLSEVTNNEGRVTGQDFETENGKREAGIPSSLRGGLGRGSDKEKFVQEILRETIIPIIEEEVNHGETFANLRQIYNAMLLSAWYKKRLKESLLGQVYADKNDVSGIRLADSDVEGIWAQYVETFQKGAYDYIGETYDPATGDLLPKRYFSGGAVGVDSAQLPVVNVPIDPASLAGSMEVRVDLAELAEQDLEAVNLFFNDWAKSYGQYYQKPLRYTATTPQGIYALYIPSLGITMMQMHSEKPVDYVVLPGDMREKVSQTDETPVVIGAPSPAEGRMTLDEQFEFWKQTSPYSLPNQNGRFFRWNGDGTVTELAVKGKEKLYQVVLSREAVANRPYDEVLKAIKNSLAVNPAMLSTLEKEPTSSQTEDLHQDSLNNLLEGKRDRLLNDFMEQEGAPSDEDLRVYLESMGYELYINNVLRAGSTVMQKEYLAIRKNDADQASLAPGGIDFNASGVNMDIKVSDEGFVFPKVDAAMLERFHIGTIRPRIIQIRPLGMPVLRQMLGMDAGASGKEDLSYQPTEKALRPDEVVL